MHSALMTLFLSAAVGAPAPEGADKPLRVLLAAGGPTREYQFVRTLFVEEADKERAQLSIYLQGIRRAGVVQDVTPERLLRDFPDKLGGDAKDEERHYDLANYDVVIAFDLDWAQLKAEQQKLLAKWVENGGGLIVVGGPLHTYRLARKDAAKELKPIIDLLPVVPEDSRVRDGQRPTDQPWQLNFRRETADLPFLRLDGERKAALAGWDDFFAAAPPKKGEKPVPTRGFYNYYPVKAVKEGATVITTFADPKSKLANGQEQPFLVTHPQGKGSVVWIGAGETWRLRQNSEAFHSRFWRLLSRYAASLPQEKES